jgi:hypothetical protein
MTLPSLSQLLDHQRGILSRAQALIWLGQDQLRRLLARDWQVVLPGVYAAFSGALVEEQRLWVAYLYCGEGMRLTDRRVLERHDIRFLPEEDSDDVHVLLPWEQTRKSRSFVTVTRTRHHPEAEFIGSFPAAPLARALVDFGLRFDDDRVVLAVLADAVQRRKVSVGSREKALENAGPRGRRQVAQAVDALRAGIRSAPENDFRLIARKVRTPPVLYNPLLQLPSGRRLSPDALIVECGLVHESNGRIAHAEEDTFESMQERHDVMTTAGLTLLHNGPRRLLDSAQLVRSEWQQCARRLLGRGLPPGVVILRPGPVD